MTMRAFYRYNLCGKEFGTFMTGLCNAEMIMTSFIVDYPELNKDKSIRPKTLHYCGNGDEGIADFIGFKMEVEDEKENNS